MAFQQLGIQGYQQGAIYDQTLLLQDIRNGLAVYNTGFDPWIEMLCETTIREKLRVSQAPKQFTRAGDGGNPEDSKMIYRILNVPIANYDLSSEFTVQWLQDALASDIVNEVNGAMAGDVELVNSLLYQSLFVKQTAGSIGTAYQASFYNGETDVPPYKNNTFGSAHYHYLGLNTTTLALSHLQAMKKDLQEHGYGLTPGSLHLLISTTEIPAVGALMNSNTTILQAPTTERSIAIDRGVIGTGVMLEGIVIHVDDNVPAGYLCMLATDVVKPVARRVHFRTEYQGLQMFSSSVNENYPLEGMKFFRRIGFAIQHLGAGTCRQLVASTTYTNPTFRLG